MINFGIISEVSAVLWALSAAYLLLAPFLKKRPVVLGRGGIIILVFLFLVSSSFYFELMAVALASVLAVIIYFSDVLFVGGVTLPMISEAVQKAALMTRTIVVFSENKFVIGAGTRMAVSKLGNKSHLLLFKTKEMSKKIALTRTVFKKFLNNYKSN